MSDDARLIDPHPNAETIAAMEEARSDTAPGFTSVADLMADLNGTVQPTTQRP